MAAVGPIALDLALLRIEHQNSALAAVRSNAATLLAIAGVGVSFLAPLSLDEWSSRSGCTKWLTLSVSSALVVAVVVVVVMLMWPTKSGLTVDVTKFRDEDWTRLDKEDASQEMAEFLDGHANKVQHLIDFRLSVQAFGAVFAALSVLSWLLAAVTA